MDYNLHQDKTNTGINRYPDIFKFCFDLNSNPENVLSYGCSSGEEVQTLSMFFGQSNVYGVEINDDMIERCRLKFKYIDRIKVTKNIIDIKYDFIFCMSVFCRWPDTEKLDDCSEIYEFDKFNSTLIELDQYLNLNGYLIIYNSNFIFEESSLSDNYLPIGDWNDSGFVHKFSKENKKTNMKHKNCVFQKTK